MDTNKFALKTDIKALRGEVLKVEERVENLEEDIKKFRAETKEDNERLEAKLDKLQNTLDGFVRVVDDLRTENTVGAHHTSELQLKVLVKN